MFLFQQINFRITLLQKSTFNSSISMVLSSFMISIQKSKFNKLVKGLNFYFKNISSLSMEGKANKPSGGCQNINDQHGVDARSQG